MNQITENPFVYSNTNKRYYTFSYYLRQKYGRKTAKIPLDAGFTCPNRDGSIATGGCLFCSDAGSGDSILMAGSTLEAQFQSNWQRLQKKWPNVLPIPYFQSFSNTYAPLDVLKKLYQPFLENPSLPSLMIATRADCLDEEFLAFLAACSQKEIWIELGLQSVHDSTMKKLNRGHDSAQVEKAVALCRQYGIKTCLHLINGLPGETPQMMLETAQTVARWHPDGVKFHMLHLMHNSPLGRRYLLKPWPLLSQEEYVQIVCDQLEVLPADVIIQRVTGDALKKELIAPLWTLKKTVTANEIDKELLRRSSWQSKHHAG